MYPNPLQFVDKPADTLSIKLRRALLGALFGLLGGTAFTLVAMSADRLFYPHLPMALDWEIYSLVWSWLGLGLMLVGFATNWWSETWSGLLTGTLLAATVLLVSNMPTSAATLLLKIATFLIIFLPAAVICLPIVIVLRWLVKWFYLALGKKWALGRVVLLFLLTLSVGSIGGLFMHMPGSAARGIEKMITALQAEPDPKSHLTKVPGLTEHRNQPFELYYAKSARTTQGYDVRAVYDDGYELLCTIIVYPGYPPTLSQCEASLP